MRCDECRYFDIKSDIAPNDIGGLCRRFPPYRGEFSENGQSVGVWPYVDDGDWCGEFQPIKAKSNTSYSDPIVWSRLRLREKKLLAAKSIETWGQLSELTAEEVLEFHGIGETTFNGLLEELTLRGLDFKKRAPPT